jgi:hypothetical protein
MRRFFIILAFIMSFINAKSQGKTEVGVIVSPQLSNLTPNPNQWSLTIKYNAGVTIGYYFFQRTKISSGIIFSNQGLNFNNKEMFYKTAKISLNYIQIPLFISYDLI